MTGPQPEDVLGQAALKHRRSREKPNFAVFQRLANIHPLFRSSYKPCQKVSVPGLFLPANPVAPPLKQAQNLLTSHPSWAPFWPMPPSPFTWLIWIMAPVYSQLPSSSLYATQICPCLPPLTQCHTLGSNSLGSWPFLRFTRDSLPQGLCTCSSLCLEYSPSRYPHGGSLTSNKSLFQCLIRRPSQTSLSPIAAPSPNSFPCFIFLYSI